MTFSQIARYRLQNQHLTGDKFKNAADAVRWFGAIQAQDYLGSLWAIGLRMQAASEKTVEQAIAKREIVRTWPMRGTLHFVAANDLRWMLKLLAPRVMARSRSRHQQLELDERAFGRSREIFVSALSGGRQLTRTALYQLLQAKGISTASARGLHILGQLAQEGLICFGTRDGKQPTFALLEEWLPNVRNKERDEALAELARRYFTSHGPATVQDFTWWSGLTAGDATAAVEMSRAHLARELVDGMAYWMASSVPPPKSVRGGAHLLPPFDEYTVAYKDRSAIVARLPAKRLQDPGFGVLGPVVVLDGQVVGTWKRALNNSAVKVTPRLFNRLNKSERQALAAAGSRYGAFLEQPAELT